MIAAILAAGRGSRFGALKQLAPIDGRPMLDHVIKALPDGFSEIVVVTGAGATEVTAALDLKCVRPLHNPNFAAGLSTSVQVAAAYALEQREDLFLTLGDLPFVSEHDNRKLLANYTGQTLFSQFRGHVGPPAVLSRADLPRLFALRGDRGAKALFPDAPTVEIASASRDVDVPADLSPKIDPTAD